MIDETGINRALRHPAVTGFIGVLSDNQSGAVFDIAQTKTSIRTCSRQDDRRRPRAIVNSHRPQQEIERQARTMRSIRQRDVQRALPNGEIGTGGNDVNMIGFNSEPIICFEHLHKCVGCQQINEQTLMSWIKMLDQNEGHAVINRQGAHQFPASFKPTG